MSNKWDDMRAAYVEAEHQIRAADAVIDEMARMLVGRLRRVNATSALAELKKELQNFNRTVGKWNHTAEAAMIDWKQFLTNARLALHGCDVTFKIALLQAAGEKE